MTPVVVRVHYHAWNDQERVGLPSLLFSTSAATHSLCVCVRSCSFCDTVHSLCSAVTLTSAFLLIEIFT